MTCTAGVVDGVVVAVPLVGGVAVVALRANLTVGPVGVGRAGMAPADALDCVCVETICAGLSGVAVPTAVLSAG